MADPAGQSFDVVVIGAGPAAVAALLGLSPGLSVAAITGDQPAQVLGKSLHPKITSVAFARREAPGVADPLHPAHGNGRPLFATATTGGLANYWGQQVVRLAEADPWPHAHFPDFACYQRHCADVEAAFTLSADHIVPSGAANFDLRLPRLLLGTAAAPAADLHAMRQAFATVAVQAVVIAARASAIVRHGRHWQVQLHNGTRITGKTILLAAGALGTARLLADSFPAITRTRLHDHAPWMAYHIGLGKLLRRRPALPFRHFNALTLERADAAGTAVFASVYDIGAADVNLLLATAFGRSFGLLRGLRYDLRRGKAISLLQPVQVWTRSTRDEIEIQPRTNRFERVSDATGARDDPDLAATLSFLRSQGGRNLATSRTRPGHGFHYHNLQIAADGAFTPVQSFLETQTDGAVVCLDGSVLQEIGVRPHTLTLMAVAHRVASHFTATGR